MKFQTKLVGGLILLLVFSLIGNVILHRENSTYESILVTESKLNELYETRLKANTYFDISGKYFDVNEWDEAITNCELSRESAVIYEQGLRETLVDLGDSKIDNLYKNIIQSLLTISISKYEACEYLESASRQFNINLTDEGNSNIEEYNQKIRTHDRAVENHNHYLALLNKEVAELGGIHG